MKNEFLKKHATHIDELTSVYERKVIEDYAEELIKENRKFILALIDIDNFKYINDGYGHHFGDKVLMVVARTLKSVIGNSGILGRYGGDEFIAVFEDISEYDDAWSLMFKVLSCPDQIDDESVKALGVTLTIGMSRFDKDAKTLGDLFDLADKALYRGKMKGRNCFIIYLPEKHANIDLKTQRDKITSAQYLNVKLFKSLTASQNMAAGIREAFNYFGSYFMLDHMCIQANDEFYFNYYHPLCNNRDLKPINSKFIDEVTNHYTHISVRNTITQDEDKNNKLVQALIMQKVYSAYFCEITAFDKKFGYLRVDITGNERGRIWQDLDLSILTNMAYLIALELYYNHKTIDDLIDE